MVSYGTNVSNSRSSNCNSFISGATHGEIKPMRPCGEKTVIRIVRKKGIKFGGAILRLQILCGTFIAIVCHVLFDNANCYMLIE